MNHDRALGLSLSVGDVMPLDATSSERVLCEAGSDRWHCLTVPPQREAQAKSWLQRRGVYAFYPVEHRTVVRFGRWARLERRYLPGYVFARFPGPMIWARVAASAFVTDVVRLSSGEPGLLKPVDLDALHAMRSVDQTAQTEAAALAEARRRARVPRRGDRARVVCGPFEGFEAEVVSIGSGTARVTVNLFGRPTDAQVGLGDLDRL